MGGNRRLRLRAHRRGAVRHRHPAAQRHRQPAHGACAEQHVAGHPGALRAHARTGRAVAAGYGPRRHRHPDGGRAPARSGGRRAPRPGTRGVRRTRLEMEGRIGRRHHPATARPGRLVRLVARTLHHGRRPVGGGAQGLRRPLQGGPDLSGQAPRQLGPEAAYRNLGPGGRAARGQGHLVVLQVPGRGHGGRVPKRGHDPARDHARRHRRRRPPRRSPATPTWSAGPASCPSSAGPCRSSPTPTPTPRRAAAPSR